MNVQDVSAWLEVVSSLLTALSIIIGGSWVVYRFVLQQERYPNIIFSTDIIVIGKQDDVWIVELVATIDNRGKAQHRMKDIGFDLNALFKEDVVELSGKWGNQTNFPHRLTYGSYLPKHQEFFFVDPGTHARYSHLTIVPVQTSFLILHSNFVYANRNGYMHTAEKTIKMPLE